MENQNIEKDEEEAKAESSQYEIDEEDENGELANSKSESDEEPKMINVTFNEDDDEETKDDPDHVNIIFDEDSDGNIQVVIPEWVTNATSEKVAKDQYFELEFSFDDVVEIEFIEDVQTKQLTIEVPDIVKKICEKELDPQPDELEFGFHLEDDDQIEIEFYEDENENVTEIIIPESMKDLKKGINNNKPKESKKSYIGENEQIEIELSFSDIEFSDSTEYSYEDETTIVEYKDYFVNGKHTKREVIMNTNNDDLQIDMNSTILIDLEEIRRSVLNSKQ
ncbi:hypothetical protein TRFO_30485 [Tritrichomonas foetus]|uniref:Uncharacterized protein n=1 Tax=Tritrichomonas foetus TaxID=1144522 RepID=A0A1J4JY35_9EUKA|nr:hypothetical protein TRFO_30485 [Tritrichomonas foetus]|eukprot:OHT02422.1 hypothetical protein TRFO_30485 [Tritrichomonas foetus]